MKCTSLKTTTLVCKYFYMFHCILYRDLVLGVGFFFPNFPHFFFCSLFILNIAYILFEFGIQNHYVLMRFVFGFLFTFSVTYLV